MLSIGFIGAGNMAEAIVSGLLAKSVVEPSGIAVTDVKSDRMKHMAEVYGVLPCTDAKEMAGSHDVLVVAVKPAQVGGALRELKGACADRLVISIAAGVSLGSILEVLGERARVIRVMPNACCLIGEGVSVMSLSGGCTDKDRSDAMEILGAVGTCMEMDELHLDAVTALSGSGPAFCFMFLEALCDGAVRAGLPRDVAYQMAGLTLKGAAEMALKLGGNPGRLKDMVASPSGTTIEGIAALEAGGFRSSVIEAVTASWRRAREMSGGR